MQMPVNFLIHTKKKIMLSTQYCPSGIHEEKRKSLSFTVLQHKHCYFRAI